ncbi:2-furoyl-CoA dehydrogenase large subunit [Flavobacteriaceae bacterium MAR_2009_75]|uniref:CoxG family protein n=1 Tax=Pseudozobellia sp. WGM2 TaxID=2787625 RepID=UPI000C2BDD94|nr:carbon monoxide dehydrogenase subunit G [Pseudozobellia sp. WGM2]PKA99894.1 2-furoyl-CoA dehydrogenase large subunit [Flavobacteriaceae bacterium MAR_2009_75]
MKINGNYTLNVTPKNFWQMVMDPEVLEKVTPGIKELKEQSPDNYEAISEVKVGPVRGNFKGNLSIKDKVEEERCTLVVDQKSKMGNVVAEIVMTLAPTGDSQTEVKYTGEAKMSGTLASMGQRIMSGVVSTLSKQFFKSMEAEIAERQA